HVGEAEHDGADDGVHHGERHGAEHLAFHAGEREDGDVDDEDDELAEGGRLHHAAGGMLHFIVHLVARQQPLALGQVVHAEEHGLHDDHGTVNYEAEIDRAKAHQIAADAGEPHEDHGEEHAERDHAGHDEARAQLAQEKHQDEDHDQRTFHQVVAHGAHGPVHQVGAVQEGLDHHALGKTLADLIEPHLHGIHYLAGVPALEHHHDAAHYLAFAVTRHGAIAGCGTDPQGGHVAHQQRRALARGVHHDEPQVLQTGGQAHAPDEVGVVGVLDVRAAGVGVVALQGIDHIADAEAHGMQANGVHRHFELLQFAAEAIDLGHAGHAQQLPADHPVLQFAQLLGVVLVVVGAVGAYHVLEHFAEAGAHGREEGRVHAGGHGARQLLQ